jgi:HK97 family phage major capsid protein/HK97 family phage prohead protease
MKNRTIEAGILYRKASLSLVGSMDDSGLVTCSISSDIPCLRWYGMEILSHAPGAANLDRVQAGACPFIADHDTSKLIGKVISVQLDGHRAIATIKMGTSELAAEILRDMQAGIRTEVSIGYRIDEMEPTGEDEDGVPTFKGTKWTLYEVSSVTIPADITVGLGRSIEQTNITQVVENKGAKMEQKSMKQSNIENILAIGKIHNMEKEAAEALRKGMDADVFRKIVLAKLEAQSAALPQIAHFESDYGLGLSKREQKEFSLSRAVEALASGDMSRAGLELETHKEIARQMGPTRGKQSLYVPFEALVGTRAMTTASQGAAFVSSELRGDLFIDVLRNQAKVIEAGATIIRGLTSDVDIPRQTGATTGYWIAEGADVTAESAPTYDNVSLQFKTVGGYVDWTRKQRIQSCLDIENLLRQDLTATLGLALDLGSIAGTGLAGQPTGIISTTGIGAVTLGAGPVVTWANILEMESDLATENTLTGRTGYMFGGDIMKLLKQTERTSGNGRYLLDLSESDKLNGHPWHVTNQVPAGKILFGNWADLLIGIFGPGIEISVDPYTLGKSGGLRIIAFLSCDVALRNAKSFTLASA